MKAANVVNLADFQHAENFPPTLKTGGKSASESDEGGNPQSSQFAGHSADSAPLETGPTVDSGGKKKQAKGKGKTPVKGPPQSHTPTVERTPGPDGYKVDCAKVASKEWTLETLKSAYPSEAMSWKKSKERAAKNGMTWDPVWDKFNVFLLDMGPKASPDHTLDRKDPAIKAYGPGLCRWLDKKGQANNKTNNLKIWDPQAMTYWSSHQLAEVHKVPVETIHKWSAAGWTNVELLAGKKDSFLAWVATEVPDLFKPPASAKVSIKDAPHDSAAPPPALRLPLTFLSNFKMPDPYYYDPCDYDPETDEAGPASAAFKLKLDELRAVKAWYDAWNAGEPCTLYPPPTTTFNLTGDMTKYVKLVAGKQWTPATPVSVADKPTQPVEPKPQPSEPPLKPAPLSWMAKQKILFAAHKTALSAKAVVPALSEPDEVEEDDDEDDEQDDEAFYATACDEDFNEETGYVPSFSPAKEKTPAKPNKPATTE